MHGGNSPIVAVINFVTSCKGDSSVMSIIQSVITHGIFHKFHLSRLYAVWRDNPCAHNRTCCRDRIEQISSIVNRALYILSIDAFCINSEMYISFNIGPHKEYRFWSASESFINSVEKDVETYWNLWSVILVYT